MMFTMGTRWLIALAARRARRRRGADPADMGTDLGLEATTAIDEPASVEAGGYETRSPAARSEYRQERRSRR